MSPAIDDTKIRTQPGLRALEGETLRRIGVFDSGVGGLSVLRALQGILPAAEFTYVADSGNAPYGERDDSFVVERSERIARYLLATAGSQLLVVACNTATAAAVRHLRMLWPALPIVGVEPGLKPAVAASKKHNIGVLATPSTLRSDKFQRLLEQYAPGADVHLQPCPGLAVEIEKGQLDSPELISMIEGFCKPLRDVGVDVAVLGCTHYAFVQNHIARAIGHDVKLVDTAEAVARQAAKLALNPLGSDASEADARHENRTDLDRSSATSVSLFTTGEINRLKHVASSLLSFPYTAATVAI
ncbi:hypothetical protein BH09PSE5_BH09PSE5_17180 [soil metagenome]